jgi:hypothetical protein
MLHLWGRIRHNQRMVWEYSFDRDRKILEVKVKGILTKVELDAMAMENLVEIRKLDWQKCLLNYMETEKALSVLESYERPKEIKGFGITARYRIALLVPSERLDAYRFLENVYRNNNLDFGVFTARDSAIAFLTD